MKCKHKWVFDFKEAGGFLGEVFHCIYHCERCCETKNQSTTKNNM